MLCDSEVHYVNGATPSKPDGLFSRDAQMKRKPCKYNKISNLSLVFTLVGVITLECFKAPTN